MSYFLDIVQIQPIDLKKKSNPVKYAAVVGTVEPTTVKQISGQNGLHLQFEIKVNDTIQYQADLNVQSSDGSEVMVDSGDETLTVQAGSTSFGDPAYGVYTNAQLSYPKVGLTEGDFTGTPASRIENQLKTAFAGSTFVAVFGQTFDDGGPNGKGIHDIHFYPGLANQDGALAVYTAGANGAAPTRTWFFFKFNDQTIP